MAPVLGCFLVFAGLFHPKDGETADLTGAGTNNLLATLLSNQSYVTYNMMAGYPTKQNAVGVDTLEWTNSHRLSSSVGSFPAFNTNGLMR